MKKSLAIIGNGFDRAHGLKTDYKSFFNQLPKSLQQEWNQLLNDYTVDENHWYAFEDAMHHITLEWQSNIFLYLLTVKLKRVYCKNPII